MDLLLTNHKNFVMRLKKTGRTFCVIMLLATKGVFGAPLGKSLGEPDGAFGLRFGHPIPESIVVTEDRPEFKRAVDYYLNCYNLPITRAELGSEWDELIISKLEELGKPDCTIRRARQSREFSADWWIDLMEPFNKGVELEKLYSALRVIFEGKRFLAVVEPPMKNENFDAYIVGITPVTGQLASVTAFGRGKKCFQNTELPAYFLTKYPALRKTFVTEWMEKQSENDETYSILFAELLSENVRVYIGCNQIQVTNKQLETLAEKELGELIRRFSLEYSRYSGEDKSGL